MANARIELVGSGELELITSLYNQVFSPPKEVAFFERRFQGRRNVTQLVASIDDHPVGFALGLEITATTYFNLLVGVIPDFRRLGLATQLMQALEAWATEHDYPILRFECQNQHRPMLHVAITEGFDLVGIRHDIETGANVVIFEKELHRTSN